MYLADIIGNYSEGNYKVNRTQHLLMRLFVDFIDSAALKA